MQTNPAVEQNKNIKWSESHVESVIQIVTLRQNLHLSIRRQRQMCIRDRAMMNESALNLSAFENSLAAGLV